MNLKLISGARFYVVAVFGVLFIAIFFQNCSPSMLSIQSNNIPAPVAENPAR